MNESYFFSGLRCGPWILLRPVENVRNIVLFNNLVAWAERAASLFLMLLLQHMLKTKQPFLGLRWFWFILPTGVEWTR